MIASMEEAKKAILNYFNPDPNMEMFGDEYIIVDEDTIEKDYGWIFHVTSRLFVETGNEKRIIIGLGPVVVEKSDGSVHTLGSVYSRATWVKIYEAERRPSLMRSLIANWNILLDDVTGRKAKDYPTEIIERARQRRNSEQNPESHRVKTPSA